MFPNEKAKYDSISKTILTHCVLQERKEGVKEKGVPIFLVTGKPKFTSNGPHAVKWVNAEKSPMCALERAINEVRGFEPTML